METDRVQHDKTATELLVVKVVANLDLPGAPSVIGYAAPVATTL
jgi:hypothetical protein